MSCCELVLRVHPKTNRLICDDCSIDIAMEKKESADGACKIHYHCGICGKERYVDCGTKIRAETVRGTRTIFANLSEVKYV